MTRSRLAVLAVVSVAVVLTGCSLGTAKPATYVTDLSATLNAEVSSNEGGEVLYWFEWGTTTEYGNVTPDRALNFAEGHTADGPRVQVSEPLSGLEPDTTYHYRACTSPGAEEGSRGCTNVDQTFTTGPAGASRSGIAFESGAHGFFDVHVMDADGSNPTNLTNSNSTNDIDPAWSPDGSKIVFSKNTEIYVMDADGGNQANLTNFMANDDMPAWSPDGTKIAFQTNRDGDTEIYVMDADGSNHTSLTANSGSTTPAWSPDGTKIAFESGRRDNNGEIYVMDADGSNPTNLTNAPTSSDSAPAWSPDGTKIAFRTDRGGDGFGEIYVMDADGSNQTNLTNAPTSADYAPAWSPDGTKIAFPADRDGSGNLEIYVMDADGDNQTNLTNNAATDTDPAWSPRP